MQVLGFVPTGWAYEMKRQKFPVYRKDGVACEIHLVPYSEHSSFNELLEFVKFLRPRQVRSTPDAVQSPSIFKGGKTLKGMYRVCDLLTIAHVVCG
jgi:hypothetical protein